MCGITGAIWLNESLAIRPERLAAMTAALAHRGPDDQGHFHREFVQQPGFDPVPGVALGATRLAIIDLPGGQQPLCNEDESLWLVGNGEIYNHADLRKRLHGTGHRFRTQGDLETLLHLYEDEGLGFLQTVVGMFAVALWDRKRRQLILARDRLGQKPLIYHQQPGRLLFASELKSLAEVPDLNWSIDPAAVDGYFTYGYVPGERTIYSGFAKLPPGTLAVWRDDHLNIRRYWAPDWNTQLDLTAEEAGCELRQRLTTAVGLRLTSDVPVGVFLSGGIDSSIVAALAQQQSTEPIQTFALGFDDPAFDEAPFARRVAEHLGSQHQEFRLAQADWPARLDDLARSYDEPFADSSAIPTLELARRTRAFVKVALTGDGGDELFAGYPHHLAAGLAAWVDRTGLPLAWLARFLPAGRQRRGFARRLKRFLEGLRHRGAARHLAWISLFNERERAALYTTEGIQQLAAHDPVAPLAWAYERLDRRDAVTQSSLADLLTYLPGDLLTKLDTASMAWGLECRSPFLDHRVVEFAAQLPVRYKLRRGRGKWLLAQAFADLLPAEVFTRPKRGFALPLESWLREAAPRSPTEHETPNWFQPERIAALEGPAEAASGDRLTQRWAWLIWQRWWAQHAPRVTMATGQAQGMAAR